ncbi:MAG: hypothetical protein RLY78_44 [Pseudomonadota bacterium]
MSLTPILLAPMEGLLDHDLRDALTRAGGLSRCVSEFIRITDQLLPPRVFLRIVPELAQGSRTAAGVPVRPQLLGSDPVCLADNAARLAELGAEGVDLNFGCPAKIVNRHRGGAILLDEPELLQRIVQAVRDAVPAGVPVSAKMRLGNLDDALAIDCAQALVAGGAQELVVHGRTKVQGYRPPAWWDAIGRIRQALPATVPVVANGEIWTVEDALRCRAESACDALMLGRGMVADPGLALALRAHDAVAADGPGCTTVDWPTVLGLLLHYADVVATRVAPRHQAGRVKQWLHYLRRRHPQAQALYEQVRTIADPRQLRTSLELAKAHIYLPLA